MKKKFVLALALALTLSLTACNKPEPAPAAPSPSETITETAPVAPTPEPTPEQPEEPTPTEPTPEQPTPAESIPELPQETPAVEVAPEEPVSTEPIEEPTPAEPVDLFTDTSETVYATQTVNIRSNPDAGSEKVGQLSWSDSILRTGVGFADTSGWSEVELADGSTAYISSKYLSTIKPEPKPVTPPTQTPSQQTPSKPVETPSQESDSQIDIDRTDSYLEATGGLTGEAAKKGLEEGRKLIEEEYCKDLEEIGGYIDEETGTIVLPPPW